MTDTAPLLQLDNIVKNYGAIEALKGISFDIDRGQVVALLGDNGAGKSTLVKIIAGGLEATSGRIVFDGVERHFTSPAEAKAAGIETVYQDLSLCTNVDVVANFFMGREIVKRFLGVPILQEREMQAVVEKAMANAGTRIPSMRTNVENLSGGQRQAIELNRFVHWGRQAGAAGRALRGPGRRADAARPRHDQAHRGAGHRRRHHHAYHGPGLPGRRPHGGDPAGQGCGQCRTGEDQPG